MKKFFKGYRKYLTVILIILAIIGFAAAGSYFTLEAGNRLFDQGNYSQANKFYRISYLISAGLNTRASIRASKSLTLLHPQVTPTPIPTSSPIIPSPSSKPKTRVYSPTILPPPTPTPFDWNKWSQDLQNQINNAVQNTSVNGSGACSDHGGVNCSAGAQLNGNVVCNDGWIGSTVSYSSVGECTTQQTNQAVQECVSKETAAINSNPFYSESVREGHIANVYQKCVTQVQCEAAGGTNCQQVF